MRIVRLLLVPLLLVSGLSALAPVAQAKPYCTWEDSHCDGLVCTYRPSETCVGDRCWFTCWHVDTPLSAATPAIDSDLRCADIYNQWEVGPVTVTQRSSCEYDVEVFGREILLA